MTLTFVPFGRNYISIDAIGGIICTTGQRIIDECIWVAINSDDVVVELRGKLIIDKRPP